MVKKKKKSLFLISKIIKIVNFKYLVYFQGNRFGYFIGEDKKLMAEIGKLRKHVYAERDYVVGEEIPDIWLDEYDDESVNFYAKKKGRIIGVVRLIIKKETDFQLPVEKYFNLEKPIPLNYAEVSKLAVHNDHRGGKRLIFACLLQEIARYSRKNKIKDLVMFMPEWLYHSIQLLGIDIHPLEYKELTEKERKARHVMRLYFEKQSIRPYRFIF